MNKVLPRDFYTRSPLLVAKDLLGKILVRKIGKITLSGRIIETEAYLGFEDEASHSFKGKTKRNNSLFLEGGHAYVHQIHMQHCLDVVTEHKDVPNSVLVRALEPLTGTDDMKNYRNKENLDDLTSGPGKLCTALHIKRDMDGIDMTKKTSPLYIVDDNYDSFEIVAKKRVGISKAADYKYRFYIKDSKYISKK